MDSKGVRKVIRLREISCWERVKQIQNQIENTLYVGMYVRNFIITVSSYGSVTDLLKLRVESHSRLRPRGNHTGNIALTVHYCLSKC